jgi:hypothetical protein
MVSTRSRGGRRPSPRMASITAQPIPGAASQMTSGAPAASCFAYRTTAASRISPTSSSPPIRVRNGEGRAHRTVPIVRDWFLMACSGQTYRHPSQPWQRSGRKKTPVGRTLIAPKRQKRPHSPHSVHRSLLKAGTVTRAGTSREAEGKERWRFGPSTSQSTPTTPRDWASVNTRFAATVVFPVPPLPLATTTLMPSPQTISASVFR